MLVSMGTTFFCITFLVSYPFLTSALFPILNPDNSVNIDSLAEHVKDLEQLVIGLTGPRVSNDTELLSIKNELAALKAQTIKDRTELTIIKAELDALKICIQNDTTLKSELEDVKIQSQKEMNFLKLQLAAVVKHSEDQVNRTEIDSIYAELTSLKAERVQDYASLSGAVAGAKSEIMAVKAELRIGEGDIQHIEDRLRNVTDETELTDLKHELESLKSGIGSRYQANLTIIDGISHDVKSNTRDITALIQSVNKTETDNKETEKQLQAFVSKWNQSKLELDRELKLLKDEFNTTERSSTSARGHLASAVNRLELKLNHTQAEVVDNKQSTAACVHLVNVVADRSRNHTEQEIAKLKGDIDTKESSLADWKNKASADINNLQHTINKLIQRNNVSFQATISRKLVHEYTYTNNPSPLTFHVEHNNGNGFEADTGKFTAPVSGMYIFMFKGQHDLESGSFTLHTNNGAVDPDLIYHHDKTNRYQWVSLTHLGQGNHVYLTFSNAGHNTGYITETVLAGTLVTM